MSLFVILGSPETKRTRCASTHRVGALVHTFAIHPWQAARSASLPHLVKLA
jgi:hypothetical protein